MILLGTIQQAPAPGATSDDGLHVDEVQGVAETYEDAHEQLAAAVLAGWRLVAIRRS